MNIAGLLGSLWVIIRLVSKKSLVWAFAAYSLMKKFNLHMVVLFFILVVPELLGSYRFLIDNGVEWYIAAPGAFGAEAGGSVFTVINNLLAVFSQSAFTVPVLLIGVITSITTFLWYIWLFYKILGFFQGMNPVTKLFLGSVILSLMMIITIMIDMYILPQEDIRVGGMTYFIENPGESLSPLFEFLSEQESGQGINETVNSTNG